MIWPENFSVRDFTGQWWVAHTRSRNEKALAADLAAKQISYFLPMSWKIHHTRGRKLKSLMPVFTSYLFFCCDENQRVEALKTNRIANLIEVNNTSQFVNELAQIEQALRAGKPLQPHEYVKKGQKCRVKSGPLQGLQGIVIQTLNEVRLVLKIDMLGQAASVEIDLSMIEPESE